MHQPRVLVITSCTGEKRFRPTNPLKFSDFKDVIQLQSREAELAEFACSASSMYTGQQHKKAMEGVQLLRQSFGPEAVDVMILSAGYGLIPENKTIVPYEVTFSTMKGYEIDEWAKFLKIHTSFEQAIVGYDLVFVLLGENYLRSLSLPVKTEVSQILIFLASHGSKKYIAGNSESTFILPLSNAHAKRFGCGLVGLKGAIFINFAHALTSNPEWLRRVHTYPETFSQVIAQNATQLELPGVLPEVQMAIAPVKTIQTNQYRTYKLIPIPDLPPAPNKHLGMRYFIPEWDDQVDPGYDFLTDTPTSGRTPHEDDIYAHQIYQPHPPNYDGILVSRVVVEGNKKKKAAIEVLGIKEYIRWSGLVMGDCGAFGYIKEEEPPYTTEEILNYYEQCGFDYGVSIDHLIVGPFALSGVRKKRYDLTLKNAEEFLQKHQSRGCQFTPVGVAQGWSPDSYADAIKDLIRMGYNHVALGGLARSQTQEILEILTAIHPHLTSETRMHLFGVARINAICAFRHLGITSFDSASSLRQAWLDSGDNYHAISDHKYAAIRVPPVEGSGVRIKRILDAGIADKETLKNLEQAALKALREYDAQKLNLEKTLAAILAYDELLELPRDGKADPVAQASRRSKHKISYRKLLEDKPWLYCTCPICQKIGIEVVIFRGNDRNRRRGFHNTCVFYKKFQDLIKAKDDLNQK